MRNLPTKHLIALWIGFAAFVAMLTIALTAEASLNGPNGPMAVVLLALAIPAGLAYFTLVRAMLGTYGFSWLRLVGLLLVPAIPFAFLAVVTWKHFAARRWIPR